MPLISPAASWLSLVAKVGSIRRAAVQLNVSPSAVNRQILELEAEYGAALFERLPRGLPPHRGRRPGRRLERWQHDHARALRGLANCTAGSANAPLIGLMGSFGSAVVSRLMMHTRERRLQALARGDRLGGMSLSLRSSPAASRTSPSAMPSRASPRSSSWPARRRSRASSRRAPIRWPAASRSGWPTAPRQLRLSRPSLTSRRILEKALRRAGCHPAATATTNSIEVMKTLVREHRQIALLALPDIHSDLVDGEFVHIPFADRHVRGSRACR